ncbi:MAG: DUF1045 domain-containing protein [Pseudomonadota bacterium]
MTIEYNRYAVYFVPPRNTPLAGLGRKWLGVDPEDGILDAAPTPWVDSPRRYGFHATLKAPMRLVDTVTEKQFLQAVASLAQSLKPVSLGNLNLRRIGSFLALVHDQKAFPDVNALAWECVTELDHLRAPLTIEEINKRKNLSKVQNELLNTWGYPYIGSEFRFHMTLSSSLSTKELDQAEAALTPLLSEVMNRETVIEQITVLGDPGGAKPFELVQRFDLKG